MDTENTSAQNTPRPFGFWLRAVDRLLTREFESAFAAEGVSRRDWRLLSLLDGDVAFPELSERLQRHGGKKLRGLVERGWVVESDGAWALTDDGRAAKARLAETVEGIRSRASEAVSADDFATTLASLEAIARELGWSDGDGIPRSRRGFGPRGGRHGLHDECGRGHRHGDAPRHAHGRAHGHHAGHHRGEHAYERGFDAGFARGREAHSA